MTPTTRFPQFYNKLFDYSLKKTVHITFFDILKSISMKDTNRLIVSSKYIHKDMPIKFANRIMDLNNLPFGLSKNHSVNKIREWYITSFLELTEHPEPNTFKECEEFKKTVAHIFDRHAPTLMTMSKGLYELNKEKLISDIDAPKIQATLTRFYKNRTELRIIIEQHLALFEQLNPIGINLANTNKQMFGIVNLQCDLNQIIKHGIADVQYICNRNYLGIDLDDVVTVNLPKKVMLIPSIEHYLYYVFFELIKNSVQAVLNKRTKYATANNPYTPQIIISLHELNSNWILVHIKDNGVGINSQDLEKIWYYSFTTNTLAKDIIEEHDFSIRTPLSGFGYGLPISEIYMNFLNASSNNIKIDSTYGEGTDVFIYLRGGQTLNSGTRCAKNNG